MIKCNVTVCGTVSRQAQMRANKEGTQFASFGINIVIPAKSGINKTVEISVAKTCNNLSELPPIQVGTRIEVAGILMFHKKGEALYLNLSATGINTFNAGNNDGINGTMEFRGTLGKQIEDKTTKNGKSLRCFQLIVAKRMEIITPIPGYALCNSTKEKKHGCNQKPESMPRGIWN